MVRGDGCIDDAPHLIAAALVSMLNQFCLTKLSRGECGSRRDRRWSSCDNDDACITNLATIFYRAIYHKETGPT